MTEPNTTTPDCSGQDMTAILGAFAVLNAVGVSPLVAFMLPAIVVVVIAALRMWSSR